MKENKNGEETTMDKSNRKSKIKNVKENSEESKKIRTGEILRRKRK